MRKSRFTEEQIVGILQQYAAGAKAATAMRLDEICRVAWTDLDADRRMLLIRDRKDPRNKTGNDQRIPLFAATGFDAVLIVATSLDDAGRGLNLYRKRWGIECIFADAKTRGLNNKDTHITDPDKLATLLVLIALAVTWAYRCATRVMGRKAITRKAHGRREKSWFRTGLDALRNWILHQPGQALTHG